MISRFLVGEKRGRCGIVLGLYQARTRLGVLPSSSSLFSSSSSRCCGVSSLGAMNAAQHIRILDGGTGEELFSKNWRVPDDRMIWSAIAVKEERYHEALKQVHLSFLKAGSMYVTCNNFGITPGVGFSEDSIKELNQIAGRIARDAVSTFADVYGVEREVLGSLPPLVESYRPDKVMGHDEGRRVYKECIVDVMDEYVDGWLAETLSSSDEVIMALHAIHDSYYQKKEEEQTGGKTTKPVYVSMCVKRGGCVRSGETASEASAKILEKARAWGIQLCGILFNCSRPEDVTLALRDMGSIRGMMDDMGVALGAYPNRLTEISDTWELASNPEPQAMRQDLDEEAFVQLCMEWVEQYHVTILGGCCGIGPEYIERLSSRCSRNKMPTTHDHDS
ncbi:Methionine synthase [Picochlorum sp. SENEW3]|nr:Methionine synthase [Picochlorum sp. SENEW3]WPT14737.1 Methionine synthase [Picochlorum sp. SENEW3]